MILTWETVYKGISVGYEDKCVHIITNQALMDFLALDGNGSVELSRYIHDRYTELTGTQLDISVDSLAVEILIHAYLDSAFRAGDRLTQGLPTEIAKALSGFFERLQERTDVIDCGETCVDSNRFVFDLLAPFHSVIYAILGDKA